MATRAQVSLPANPPATLPEATTDDGRATTDDRPQHTHPQESADLAGTAHTETPADSAAAPTDLVAVAAQVAPVTGPTPLSPAEVRRGLRLSIIEGAVATVNISITGAIGGSVFLTGFALLLGANSFQLGLMGALPFIGQAFQFVGAYLEERVGNRRALTLYGSLLGRLVWVFLLALPFLSFLRGAELAIFMVGLAISYAFNGIAGNAWLSWMSDMVPARQRGSYFGLRNTVVGVATMASTFVAGQMLDSFRLRGTEALGYAAIFGLAIVAALGSALLVSRQPEPPLRPKARVSVRELLVGPTHDRRFRSYALAAAGWALVTGIAAPFFNAYGLNNLQLSFSILALTAIVTSAVSLVFTPLTGRLQDKLGDRKVLLFCMLGTIPLPWGWVLSTPENIWPLWFTAIFSGVFWPGVTQGLVNVLMDRAPVAQRGAAMASYSAITGMGTLLAGLLGGLIATLLTDIQFSIGAYEFAGIVALFVLTSLGRAAMITVFWRTV
jgi:MFS family permease